MLLGLDELHGSCNAKQAAEQEGATLHSCSLDPEQSWSENNFFASLKCVVLDAVFCTSLLS